MEQILENNKICAILRNIPEEITMDYVTAAFHGGIRLFEVAMNSPHAARQISMIREHMGNQVFVGAGTVIDETRCQAAKQAGAQFFLTPSVSLKTFDFCKIHEIPLLPGVLTPSDVAVCLEHGYKIMKLFPAADLPQDYIKNLTGPFEGTKYIAVGGVSSNNIKMFFNKGFTGVGIGSNLIPREYINNRKWDEATLHIQHLVQQCI